MYGGSTTSILLNVPGEPASVMTAVEGHRIAKQGRAGAALSMSAISSFCAGTAAVVGLMFLAPPLARWALAFGPVEEFALMLAAFTLVASLSGGSLIKGLIVALLGVVVATIGPEPVVAQSRLTFGLPELEQGISFVAAAIGLFALPEVLEAVERPGLAMFQKTALRLKNLLPSAQDFRESKTALPMGALVGFLGGIIPGGGATISSFLAYGVQKRISRYPSKFGNGSIEAVAAVEGANNAASTSALIPLLTFGIPGTATAAVLMGAMLIHGLRPGPLLFESNPEVVWSLIASMYIGNVMLLILNLPLIGIWISALRLPTQLIVISVTAISVVGVFAEDNSIDAVYVMFFFGVLGYFLKKLSFPMAPIVLALVLTAPLEASFFKSLSISGGDWTIFFTRPLSLMFLAIAALSIVLQTPIFWRMVAALGGTSSRSKKLLDGEQFQG